MSRQTALAKLAELGISYTLTEHPAVYTIEEMDALGITAEGEVVKNLFLRDAKGKRHFLLVLGKDKRADLKHIGAALEASHLSFASAERLQKYLGLTQGEVTPLGVVNDREAAVEVVFDSELRDSEKLGVHPNDNTATVWLSFAELLRYVQANGNSVSYIDI
ncbi:MAG: prolyl-tRNA synthetase associated domain-containing protein [Bacillota bacterium]|nr:prolyl-tRNA synthetase associated domain-containing protein [Bacillota bacterium]